MYNINIQLGVGENISFHNRIKVWTIHMILDIHQLQYKDSFI